MNLKEFLQQNKIIKDSALAMLMWPDKKNQAKVFSNKINEVVTGKGNSKQRITEGDEERAKVVLNELADRIKAFTGGVEEVVKKGIQQVAKTKERPQRIVSLADELEKAKQELLKNK